MPKVAKRLLNQFRNFRLRIPDTQNRLLKILMSVRFPFLHNLRTPNWWHA